jgi:hypothetical protein
MTQPPNKPSAASEFELSILNVLAESPGDVNASWVASKVWPCAGRSLGARSGQWQRMGVILAKLQARGFVWRNITEYNQKLWTIAPKGLAAVKGKEKG